MDFNLKKKRVNFILNISQIKVLEDYVSKNYNEIPIST